MKTDIAEVRAMLVEQRDIFRARTKLPGEGIGSVGYAKYHLCLDMILAIDGDVVMLRREIFENKNALAKEQAKADSDK